MEGKRFVAGLVAGLLVGLVIVTASSGFAFGPNSSPFSNTAGGSDLAKSATTSTTSTSSQPASPPSQNALNSTLSSVSRSSTTTTSTTSPVPSASDHGGSTPAPQFSSRVGSIAQQPILANAFIFLPILIAFLLGAVLYRASTKRRADSSELAE
jgi:hypothetical protein